MQYVNGSASGTSWTDQLDELAGRTSWTDQLDGSAEQTSSLYLKPWPVRTFEDLPFRLYIVAASKSNEGLVCNFLKVTCFFTEFKRQKHRNHLQKCVDFDVCDRIDSALQLIGKMCISEHVRNAQL